MPTVRDQLLAFNDLELTAKKLFEANRGRDVDPRSLMTEILSSSDPAWSSGQASKRSSPGRIPEARFLADGADVAVVKHIRYLPSVAHTHEFIELTYVYEGTCRHTLDDGTSFEMERGDLTVVPPGLVHAIAVFDDDTIVVNILIRRSTFHRAFFGLLAEDDALSEFFARLIYGGEGGQPCIRFRTGDDESIRRVVEASFGEAQENRRYRTRILNLLVMQLCTLLIGDHERDLAVMGTKTAEAHALAYKVLRYIQVSYRDSTLRNVAEQFGRSEAYVSRVVMAATGRTFRDLVRDVRIRRAAELLANPNVPIDEIVHLVGYADVSHFYRTFKRVYGTTPAEYRKQHLTDTSIGMT